MPSPIPLLHIGFPKCASSWMQKHLFIPRHGFHTAFIPAAAKVVFIEPMDLETPADQIWRERCAQAPRDGLVPVCTSEHLAGRFTDGSRDSDAIAARLAAFYPQARILLLVREQRSMVRSLYKTLIAWGGTRSVDGILDGRDDLSAGWLRWLCYDQTAERYANLYGRENVLVETYERFTFEPEAVLQRIKAFAGVNRDGLACTDYPLQERINPNSDRLSLELVRLGNRMIRTEHSPTGPLADGPRWQQFRLLGANRQSPLLQTLSAPWQRRLDARIDQLAHGHFEASNQRLALNWNLPLQDFGYALPTG